MPSSASVQGAELSFFFLFPFGVTLVMGFSSSPKAALLDPMDGCGVRPMHPTPS